MRKVAFEISDNLIYASPSYAGPSVITSFEIGRLALTSTDTTVFNPLLPMTLCYFSAWAVIAPFVAIVNNL